MMRVINNVTSTTTEVVNCKEMFGSNIADGLLRNAKSNTI